MRGPLVGILLALATFGCADRIILAPNALKVLNQTARLEYLFEPSRSDNYRAYLGLGVTRDLEVELVLSHLENRSQLGTFNASYQYLIPIVNTSPGLAFGVQDALDRTPERRMYYVAFTQRFGLDGVHNSTTPLELTTGFGFGRRSGVFVGVMLPMTWQFRILAEHDLNRVAGGFEFRPFNGAAIRTVFQSGSTQLGLRYTYKF